MAMPSYLIVRNRKSGLLSRDLEIEEGIALLAAEGGEVINVYIDELSDLGEIVRKATEANALTVIACGGDGTVNMLANALVDTELRLAVVPSGTFNHFAKHIGMPLPIVESFQAIAAGQTELIDVGEVNGTVFVNFSTVGFYAHLIETRTALQKAGISKWTAFIRALIGEFMHYEPLSVVVEGAESTFAKKTPLVFVGNNMIQFGSLDALAARESFTSGKLQVSLARDRGRWGMFLLALSALVSDIRNYFGFTTTTLEHMTINSPHRTITVTFDGEVKKITTPLEYTIRPRALRVVVPTK